MVAEPKMWFLTPEEYLRQERAAETKSEFIGGEIVAMNVNGAWLLRDLTQRPAGDCPTPGSTG